MPLDILLAKVDLKNIVELKFIEMELKEDIKKLLFDFCESAEIDGYSEQVIRKSSIDYAVEQILTLLQSNDAVQPNGSKPLVSGALPPVDNRVMFADYIQSCVIERGQMTYPSLKDAIKAWDETTERFGGNDR